ncbi:MAG: Gldg family protein [Planctomycetes bacterium]|nr:Gldg family protein [Planctomycetota bacterium]
MGDPKPAEPAPVRPEGTVRLRLAGLGGRTVVILVVLALLVAATTRLDLRWDLSADRRFTLDPALVRILRSQETPVEVVGIWNREIDEQVKPVSEALQTMVAEDPQLSWRRIDPELHKPELTRFGERFREAAYPAIYLTRGERAFRIPLTQGTRYLLQREVGGGLLALAESSPPTARFLLGHGELTPGPGPDQAGTLMRALELGGFQVTASPDATIRADSVLVIAGPTAPLGEAALKAIDQHLDDGGALLLFADDRMPLDLAVRLRRRGLVMGPAMPKAEDLASLADPAAPTMPPVVLVSLRHHVIGQDNEFPYYNLLIDGPLINSAHPATAGLAASGRNLLSPWSTPIYALNLDAQRDGEAITALGSAGVTLPASSAFLLATVPGDTWPVQRQEPPKPPADLAKRPREILAVTLDYVPRAESARQGAGARITVWSSREAVANRVLDQGSYANADLVVDLARHLARRDQATAIPAAELAVFQVNASDRTLGVVLAVLVAVIPCLFIGAAILTWLDRR